MLEGGKVNTMNRPMALLYCYGAELDFLVTVASLLVLFLQLLSFVFGPLTTVPAYSSIGHSMGSLQSLGFDVNLTGSHLALLYLAFGVVLALWMLFGWQEEVEYRAFVAGAQGKWQYLFLACGGGVRGGSLWQAFAQKGAEIGTCAALRGRARGVCRGIGSDCTASCPPARLPAPLQAIAALYQVACGAGLIPLVQVLADAFACGEGAAADESLAATQDTDNATATDAAAAATTGVQVVCAHFATPVVASNISEEGSWLLADNGATKCWSAAHFVWHVAPATAALLLLFPIAVRMQRVDCDLSRIEVPPFPAVSSLAPPPALVAVRCPPCTAHRAAIARCACACGLSCPRPRRPRRPV